MLINGASVGNNNYINKISFNANPFKKKQEPIQQSDWLDFSEEQQVPKKKKTPILNFYKKAQEKSAQIIRSAHEEPSKVLTEAYETARGIKERAQESANEEKRLRELKLQQSMQTKRIQEEEKLRRELDSTYSTIKLEHEKECSILEARQTNLEAAIKASNQRYINKEIKKRKDEFVALTKSYTLDYDYSEAFKIEEPRTNIAKAITDAQETEKISFEDFPFTPIEKTEEKTLDIPEYNPEEKWSYQIPTNGAINLPKYTRMPFEEMEHKETNISMNYADSIRWNPDKIARDLMQNFFDGHGQTLDGVRLSFEPLENGRYKIRIEGNAKYTQEKAILLGESTKRNNAKAAGNFGEGLKVVVLKLLKEYGAQEVNIASDNWKVTYKPTQSSICNQEVLSYSLHKAEEIDGNYIEFETDNEYLPNYLINSINNFYHSGNPDFQNLDFENDKFAIKKLNPDEKGCIYIAGQKFEFAKYSWSPGWQEIPGMHIIIKEKPGELNGFDISRDRVMLNKDNLKAVLKHVAKNSTSTQDCCDILNLFRKFWVKDESNNYIKKESEELFDSILEGLAQREEKFEFPEYCLASCGWDSTSRAKELFYRKNHTICKNEFRKLGMRTIDEQYILDKSKRVVEPNEKQIQKIALIKKTLECLKPYIMFARSNEKQISYNPNIYIYRDNMVFAGEYVKDGFWISEMTLGGSFEDVMTTVLHEISHVAGGDGTMEFTYELTNMIQALMAATINDQGSLTDLRALKAAWEEISGI